MFIAYRNCNDDSNMKQRKYEGIFNKAGLSSQELLELRDIISYSLFFMPLVFVRC